MLQRDAIVHRLGALDLPVLIIVGDSDIATPPDKARQIHAAIAGSRLEVIPGAGHLVTVEAPDGVSRLLLSFFDGEHAPMSHPAGNGHDPVLLGSKGHVATITLNQPERRNAMGPALLKRFAQRVEEARQLEDVRVVVLTGTGRHFCAGADFTALGPEVQQERSGQQRGDAAEPQDRLTAAVRGIYRRFWCVEALEVPTIAAINGSAIGGGLGLALACDLRIAVDDAKLGASFVRLGLAPGMGLSWTLPRVLGAARAAELMFTGRILRGAEAAEVGLVHEACAREDFAARVAALATEIARGAPEALRLTKQALRRSGSGSWDLQAALDFEASAQARCIGTDDFAEGVSALFARREPRFGTDRDE